MRMREHSELLNSSIWRQIEAGVPSNSPQQRRLASAVMISLITNFCIQRRHLTRYQIYCHNTHSTAKLFLFQTSVLYQRHKLAGKVTLSSKKYFINGIVVIKVIKNKLNKHVLDQDYCFNCPSPCSPSPVTKCHEVWHSVTSSAECSVCGVRGWRGHTERHPITIPASVVWRRLHWPAQCIHTHAIRSSYYCLAPTLHSTLHKYTPSYTFSGQPKSTTQNKLSF